MVLSIKYITHKFISNHPYQFAKEYGVTVTNQQKREMKKSITQFMIQMSNPKLNPSI